MGWEKSGATMLPEDMGAVQSRNAEIVVEPLRSSLLSGNAAVCVFFVLSGYVLTDLSQRIRGHTENHLNVRAQEGALLLLFWCVFHDVFNASPCLPWVLLSSAVRTVRSRHKKAPDDAGAFELLKFSEDQYFATKGPPQLKR
jgi:hypothetical protein